MQKVYFHKCMEFFLVEGGSCSYDNMTIGDIKFPLMYKHIVKQWVPKDIPQLNIDYCVNDKIYQMDYLSVNHHSTH